jgi:hypothetical protein
MGTRGRRRKSWLRALRGLNFVLLGKEAFVILIRGEMKK